MTGALDFTTPQQALREMQAAGAVFSVRRRDDALGVSFSYRVSDSGDANLCRAILTAVKARPAAFFAAFKMHVQDSAKLGAQGAA